MTLDSPTGRFYCKKANVLKSIIFIYLSLSLERVSNLVMGKLFKSVLANITKYTRKISSDRTLPFIVSRSQKNIQNPHCVKSACIRNYSGPHFSRIFPRHQYLFFYSDQMQENAGKMWTRTTLNTDTIYAVFIIHLESQFFAKPSHYQYLALF